MLKLDKSDLKIDLGDSRPSSERGHEEAAVLKFI